MVSHSSPKIYRGKKLFLMHYGTSKKSRKIVRLVSGRVYMLSHTQITDIHIQMLIGKAKKFRKEFLLYIP